MPRCCSGLHCISPELSLDGNFSFRCTQCECVTHGICAVRQPHNGDVVCFRCAREQLPQQQHRSAVVVSRVENETTQSTSSSSSSSGTASSARRLPKQQQQQNHSNGGSGASVGVEFEIHPSVAAMIKDGLLKAPSSKGFAKKSIWWQHFSIFDKFRPENEGRPHHACCNLCGAKVNLSKSLSPKGLRSHMESNHNAIFQEIFLIDNSNRAAAEEAAAAAQEEAEGGGGCGQSSSTKVKNKETANTAAEAKKISSSPSQSATVYTEDGTGITTSAPAAAMASAAMASAAVGKGNSCAPPVPASRKLKEFARQNCLAAVTRWILESGVSLKEVDQESFRRMTLAFAQAGKTAAPTNIGRFAVQDEISQQQKQIISNLRERMKGMVLSEARECWLSRNQEMYVCQTAQWIRDFRLESTVVGVSIFHEADSTTTSEEYEGRWQAFGVDQASQVKCLVTDRSDHMIAMGTAEEETYGKEHCYCHECSLHLIAEIPFQSDFWGSKDNTDETGLLKKARGLVELFMVSSQKAATLTEAMVHLKDEYEDDAGHALSRLAKDVVPRWWSTAAMLDCLLHLRSALQYMETREELHGDSMFSDAEWEMLGQIQRVLKPFQCAQQLLGGRNHVVTSSLVPFVTTIIEKELQNLCEEEDDDPVKDGETMKEEDQPHDSENLIKECAEKMCRAFTAHFGDMARPFHETVIVNPCNRRVGIHPIFLYAAALDPRFKILSFISDESNRQLLWDTLLNLMLPIYKRANADNVKRSLETMADAEQKNASTTKIAAANNGIGGSGSDSVKRPRLSKSGDDENALRKHFDFLRKENQLALASSVQTSSSNVSARTACQSELERYKAEPPIPMHTDLESGTFTDPLQWWKEKHLTYPTLWELARLYLAVPATSAPSDRAFSTDANMLLQKRCREYDKDVASSIIFVKENWRYLEM